MNNFKISKYTILHLLDIYLEYDIVSKEDIEKFEIIATKYDYEYIERLCNNCMKWMLKKDEDEKYYDKTKRDEIKMLERVKYRLQK